MTLSDELRKLQKELRTEANKFNQEGNVPVEYSQHYLYLVDCADDLNRPIALADEQEREPADATKAMNICANNQNELAQELAALKEPMECEHPRAFWKGEEGYESGGPQGWIVTREEGCSLCADLREVAEIAIEWLSGQVVLEDGQKFHLAATAEEVLARLRERKAEVRK